MKRLLSNILLALAMLTAMLSCSPQKQLAYLLRNHPELARDSVSVHVLESVLPLETATVYMDRIVFDIPDTVITVETERSSATLQIENGNASLTTTAKPDTITLRDTVKTRVIRCTTKTIVKKTKWYWFPICMLIGAFLAFVVRLIIKVYVR